MINAGELVECLELFRRVSTQIIYNDCIRNNFAFGVCQSTRYEPNELNLKVSTKQHSATL